MTKVEQIPEIYLDKEKKRVVFQGQYVNTIKRAYEILEKTPPEERKQKLVEILGFESLNSEEDYLKYHNVQKGDIIVDAGAHVGVFTQKFSELVGPDGLVIAVEPDFRALGMLIHNTAELQNVKIFPYALWRKEDIVPFQYADTSSGVGMGSLIYQLSYWYPVRTITLDALLEKIGIYEVDFVKMDIEGSEISALMGMQNTMKRVQAMSIASYHKINDAGDKSWQRVIDILQTKGFTTRMEQGNDGEIVYANR